MLPCHHREGVDEGVEEAGPVAASFLSAVVQSRYGPVDSLEGFRVVKFIVMDQTFSYSF